MPGGLAQPPWAPTEVVAPTPRPIAPGMPAEDLLLTLVEQLVNERTGHRAICFHLSRLDRIHRRRKHLQIATNLLMETVDQFSGRLFVLRSGDIVIICKGITARAIDHAIEALRYLFNDDPLARMDSNAKFYSVFDLEIGYAQFLATIKQIREKETRQRVKASKQTASKPVELRFNDLLEKLSSMDLSHMVCRQTVWALHPGKRPQPKFDELLIPIDRLRNAVSPEVDFSKDLQLFQNVRRWLDKYVLTRLAWEQFGRSRPVSLNLDVATLQSPDFLKFDDDRARRWRGRTILQIQLGNMWADLSAYLAIADLVKQRGYFRCLDGVTYQAFPCINFNHLKVDLVRVPWDDAMLQLDEAATRTLCQAMREYGTERIIFTRCGQPEAIQFGQTLGVRLFQGRHLDQTVG